MKKDSIIGFVLIAVILVLFSYYNSRSITEQKKARAAADSIARIEAVQSSQQAALSTIKDTNSVSNDTISASAVSGNDSISKAATDASIYKDTLLASASREKEEISTIENGKIKIDFTNKGAQPYNVLVKNYYTFDKHDLNLIRENSSKFAMVFYTTQELSTANFAFKKTDFTDSSITYKLFFDTSSYVQFKYTLPANSYLLKFDVKLVGMNKHIPANMTSLDVDWNVDMPRLEKGYDNEKNYSTVVYKFPTTEKCENLGLRKGKGEEDIRTKLNWVAFQQQFFSAILISKDNFNSGLLSYAMYPETDADKRLMNCEAKMQIPYTAADEVNIPFEYYYGPNHFKTLKSYGQGFENIVPLGGWLIGWINKYVIILVFDILSRFISNYGIIILLLTILIKLVISPLTIKSYVSSAKMRVLKPEIDKISAKYPKSEDAMKKQQETMALYKKTGVSMFGGCLPMLLQFPILFAMFKFFPASFELRQQGFLWATDLSAYDSIWNLPFRIPLYGDHVSLFALLMAVSMFFYTKMTSAQMSTEPQMAGMKFMSLYFMPVFMLFLCNNFSSGLSYYYMLTNLITIIQTWVIREFFVDEKKLYAKLQEKAATHVPKKKSKFQQRLDEAYRMQQQQLKNKK